MAQRVWVLTIFVVCVFVYVKMKDITYGHESGVLFGQAK